jgi:hypothetical protein
MLAVLQAFLNITFRRQGPEDLPASRFLLLLAVGCYLVLQFAVGMPYYDGLTAGLLRSVLLDLGLLCGVLWLLLGLAGRQARYLQTLTAMVGAGAVLNVVLLPFNWWYERGVDSGTTELIPTAGIIAIVLWSVTVNGHIFSRALSLPFITGLAISMGYFLMSVLIISRVAPVSP